MHASTSRFLGLALLLALGSTRADAQSAIGSMAGTAGHKLGASVVPTRDINGDGYVDFLVGRPGYSSGKGQVLLVSGRYLATGLGSQNVGTIVAPSGLSAQAAFGSVIANIGDVTGDTVADFAISAPGEVSGPRVYAVSGASFNLLAGWYQLPPGPNAEVSISSMADANGDGFRELLLGAPYQSGNRGLVVVASTHFFGIAAGYSSAVQAYIGDSIGSRLGAAIVGGHDFNGDGVEDFAMSAPSGGAAGVAYLYVRSGVLPLFPEIGRVVGQVADDGLGISLACAGDLNGDGRADLIAGAKLGEGGSLTGSVRVISGASIAPAVTPIDLYRWQGFGALSGASSLFGSSLAVTPDFTGDGIPEIAVGAPGKTTIPLAGVPGGVAVFSGGTGARIGLLNGGTDERLGSSVASALSDLDGDGWPDLVAGGPLSSAAGTDAGVVKAFRMWPSAPLGYCYGNTNSMGCAPIVTATGVVSASVMGGGVITASQILNQRNGLFFFGGKSVAAPYLGGTLCVLPPFQRTPIQNSGGSATGSDCSGVFQVDFNALIHSGSYANLAAGREVFGQFWSRDPQSLFATNFSSAISFLINP